MADMAPWDMNWEAAQGASSPTVQEKVVAPSEQKPVDAPWEMQWDGDEARKEEAPWELEWGDEGNSKEGASGGFKDFNTEIGQETMSRLIHIESSGRADAQAKTSSARGLTQFIDTTWLASIEKYRPDLSDNLSEDEVLALRDDPKLSIEMAVRLAEENVASLNKAGVPITDGAIYLAHFAGVGTARKVLKASDDTPAEAVFTKAAIKANKSILAGKTVGQVKAWAEEKMEKAGGRGHVEKFLGGNSDEGRGADLSSFD